MSKGQINFLLALATLVVVWLYFNTFYVVAKRSYGPVPVGGIASTSAGRFLNPAGVQNAQQPPNIAELLKNQARALQSAGAARRTPPATSEIPQKDKPAKS